MTVAFVLPAPWRPDTAPGVPGDAEAVVAYADLVPGIRALSASCGAQPVDVLLAAHIAVLGVLSEDHDLHTDVVLPGSGGRACRFPIRPGEQSRRALVRHVAEDAHLINEAPDVPDGPSPDSGQVVFAASGEWKAGAYGLCVRAEAKQLRLRGRRDALTGERLAALAYTYRAVLEDTVAHPDGNASAVRLPPADRDAVLREWSDGATIDRDAYTVDALIQAQAARTPDAPAVRVPGATLTYRELERRANRVAHHLIGLGARRNALVGVHLRRTADLLPVLLGVWKSGAGYLPLDPDLPAERLRLMIEDAGCALVVTHSAHQHHLEPPGNLRLVPVDREEEAINAHPAIAPALPADPRRLAYVIYTSGSTGMPKGVMVEHRGLANYLLWTAEAYAGRGIGGSAVFSSISFDLGVPSLYTPLLVGQPVDLLPDPLEPADLGERLVDGAPYSFLKMTPGHLALLHLDLRPEETRDLAGIVIAAGDAFTGDLARRWMDAAGPGGTAVGTEYGPTEITIGNSGQPITEAVGRELLPLGTPIPNTTMYVLTAGLRPAPIGVAGEVYVGGDGVARGYVNAPALTAGRFVADPYGPPGSRLYRTGDRARWRGDGSLEFLGRADHQIKIRGYRVEPGEVQAHLRRHADVAEVVVLGTGEGSWRASLAAFIVPERGAEVDAARLRKHLAADLPAYMIPSHFVTVDRIPLTANGKVDGRTLRRALGD